MIKYQMVNDLYRKVMQGLTDAQKAVMRLRSDVIEGRESVGTPLENFLFSRFSEMESSWGPYLEMQRTLLANSGNEVLIELNRSVEQEMIHRIAGGGSAGTIGMIPERKYYEDNLTLFYGILSGADFEADLQTGKLIFPVGGYSAKAQVNYDNSSYEGSDLRKLGGALVEVIEGRFSFPVVDLINSGDVPGFGRYSGESVRTSKVLVGKDVSVYFTQAIDGVRVYEKIKDIVQQK